MERVLIIAEAAENAKKFGSLFDREKYDVKSCTVAEVGAVLGGGEFSVVFVCPPIEGTDGAEFALSVAESAYASVALLCRRERFDALENKMRPYGVFVLALPTERRVFCETLRIMCTASARFGDLNKDKIVLQGKIEELKLIDRAKFALILYLKMSEKEAHRFIEKQAMDMRVSKREICENILKTYEV